VEARIEIQDPRNPPRIAREVPQTSNGRSLNGTSDGVSVLRVQKRATLMVLRSPASPRWGTPTSRLRKHHNGKPPTLITGRPPQGKKIKKMVPPLQPRLPGLTSLHETTACPRQTRKPDRTINPPPDPQPISINAAGQWAVKKETELIRLNHPDLGGTLLTGPGNPDWGHPAASRGPVVQVVPAKPPRIA